MTVTTIVDRCPLIKSEDGLQSLHVVSDDTFNLSETTATILAK